jgi:hypothetical protein
MIDSKAVARARVKQALAEIEEAQRRLANAAQLLCPIIGFVGEWTVLGKLYDRVKAHWHKVNRRSLDNCDLDESAKRCLAEGRPL